MCHSKIRSSDAASPAIDGRQVLQPPSNRISPLESPRPVKHTLQKSTSLPTSFANAAAAGVFSIDHPSPPIPYTKITATALLKRRGEPIGLDSSTEKLRTPKASTWSPPAAARKEKKNKKPEKVSGEIRLADFSSGLLRNRVAGSVAAAQREHAALVQAQRKLRIAHYGRTPAKIEELAGSIECPDIAMSASQEEKKCSFITPSSDPVYAAYHDEEWGVPVHDDRMLFELLVLAGAQVGMDWTTILKKRNEFRVAFAEFDAESVSKFTEKQMVSISVELKLDLGRVRGIIENSKRILEVKRNFGSLDKYLWVFVNHKPISTNYKSCRKIPVKTSKSESISKDMVRRGFRFVGSTIVHSFMQAAGLTNDHTISCPRHLHCSRFAN
ncbi:uncharacterized protein LOC122052537 [Zingiber officinale]|uniref:DNA-3-methyladenine glycosylase I n=1 Tax=Zingiber officinale TaxID=94328 RepID=A0A8J5HHG9_ZINOF|nr:uncharacterized protein LOC122052537 [Zingiber officinale]KAG6522053.1 hypothetical protein ZIOFF_019187 [Zingiber officinale]